MPRTSVYEPRSRSRRHGSGHRAGDDLDVAHTRGRLWRRRDRRGVRDAAATVVDRRLVGDDAEAIASAIRELVDAPAVDAVVTAGRTEITPDDVTIDVAERVLAIDLPGFGEEFRRRSFAEVGTRAMATR